MAPQNNKRKKKKVIYHEMCKLSGKTSAVPRLKISSARKKTSIVLNFLTLLNIHTACQISSARVPDSWQKGASEHEPHTPWWLIHTSWITDYTSPHASTAPDEARWIKETRRSIIHGLETLEKKKNKRTSVWSLKQKSCSVLGARKNFFNH